MDKATIITLVENNKKAVEKTQEAARKVGKDYFVTNFALALQEATEKIERIAEDQ